MGESGRTLPESASTHMDSPRPTAPRSRAAASSRLGVDSSNRAMAARAAAPLAVTRQAPGIGAPVSGPPPGLLAEQALAEQALAREALAQHGLRAGNAARGVVQVGGRAIAGGTWVESTAAARAAATVSGRTIAIRTGTVLIRAAVGFGPWGWAVAGVLIVGGVAYLALSTEESEESALAAPPPGTDSSPRWAPPAEGAAPMIDPATGVPYHDPIDLGLVPLADPTTGDRHDAPAGTADQEEMWAGGRVTTAVPGLYESIDPTTTTYEGPDGTWVFEDEPKDTIFATVTTKVRREGRSGHAEFRSGWDPETGTFHFLEAYRGDIPSWFPHPPVALVEGRGVPLSMFVRLRQMKRLGMDGDKLRTVTLHSVVELQSTLAMNAALRRGDSPEDAAMDLFVTRSAQSALAQTGHQIVATRFVTFSREIPLAERLETRSAAEQQEWLAEAAQHGIGPNERIWAQMQLSFDVAAVEPADPTSAGSSGGFQRFWAWLRSIGSDAE